MFSLKQLARKGNGIGGNGEDEIHHGSYIEFIRKHPGVKYV
jgi:hypothetical protein